MMSELEPSSMDLKRTVVTAGVAAVPIVGGPLAVVLSDTWPDRWRQNAIEFINGVADDVEELAFEMAQLEQRLADEDVAEIFYIAGQTAQVSSHAATRRRCRNAVVNAIRQPENAAMNLRMVRMLDELTPAHFSLLALLRDPMANDAYATAIANTMGSMTQPAADALGYSSDFIGVLSGDLDRRGLGQVVGAMMSMQGLQQKRTTRLGDRLLDFVERPVAGV